LLQIILQNMRGWSLVFG
jgi:hypothetical protein